MEDGRALPIERGRQRTLLAYLLLRANEVLAQDQLVDALWGESPPASAVTALHGYVSRLRRLIGTGRLQTRPPGYVLHVAPDAAELAVRVPRRRVDGRARDLPASARLARVQARRSAVRRDRVGGIDAATEVVNRLPISRETCIGESPGAPRLEAASGHDEIAGAEWRPLAPAAWPATRSSCPLVADIPASSSGMESMRGIGSAAWRSGCRASPGMRLPRRAPLRRARWSSRRSQRAPQPSMAVPVLALAAGWRLDASGEFPQGSRGDSNHPATVSQIALELAHDRRNSDSGGEISPAQALKTRSDATPTAYRADDVEKCPQRRHWAHPRGPGVGPSPGGSRSRDRLAAVADRC